MRKDYHDKTASNTVTKFFSIAGLAIKTLELSTDLWYNCNSKTERSRL